MSSTHRRVALGAIFSTLLALSASASAKPLTGAVAMRDGRPTILVDGKPELPMIYALTDFRGGRWTWEEIPRRNLELFAELGFRLVQVDVWFEDIWAPDGKLDVALVRKQLRGVLDTNPRAALFLRFHVNAPFWWNKQHPDECVNYADGPADPTVFGPPFQLHYHDTERAVRHSLASDPWKADATAKLKELLRKLAPTPEGGALVGIQVAGGVYGEWHPWGFPVHDPDTSPAMTRYFQRWLRDKYGSDDKLRAAWANPGATFATATIPTLEERNQTTAGLFRDPQRERRIIDYYEAQQDSIADAILHFAKVVKDGWPRPIIVGTFYGYYFSTFGRATQGAHLRMNRVFASPAIDYVSAPQSYFGPAHGLGGSGQSRGIAESARLAGKLFLDEMDQGTHLKKPGDGYEPNDPKNEPKFAEDIALLRRNTAHPLMRGHGLWYYDFGAVFGAGHWDNPRFHKELRQLKDVFARYGARPHNPAADVLFVFDTEYLHGFRPRWNTINENLIDRTPTLAYRSGAVYDPVRLADLPKVDLGRYKVVVFANTLALTDADKAFIKEKVARDGRHLVWVYLPGYSDGHRLDERFVVDVTGIAQRRLSWTQKKDPRIVVNAAGFPQVAFAMEDPVEPMMVVDDQAALPIATFEGTRAVAVAKKTFPTHTAWMGTLSLHDPDLLRAIFRAGGAHIYDDKNDTVLATGDLLMVHTVDGGPRHLVLRNGKAVDVTLPPKSTQLFDAETGAALLAD